MEQGIVIRANGTRERVTPANGEYYTLKELQGFVGGKIKIINLKNDVGHVLVVNEKILGKPINKDATIVAGLSEYFNVPIVGDAFYCSKNRIK